MKNRDAIRWKTETELGRRASRKLLIWQSLGMVCAVCFASTATAQNRYQIIRIETAQDTNSAALAINNQGEVVGYSFRGEDYHAFLYSALDRSLTDVGSLGGRVAAACAINDVGQVAGYSQDRNGNYLAFLFSRKQPIASLGTLDNASTSEAFGINKNGAVVGDSQSGAQNHRPVLFSKNSVQDLGLGGSNDPDALETAYAINDAGQIVGRHSIGNNAFHAFAFLKGTTTDFSTLGGTNGEALAINKNGLVVGDSDTANGSIHAFVFEHSQLKDLGMLPGFDTASYARGINSASDVVGESDSADQKRAFLFTKGQLVELDKLAENLTQAGFNSLDVAYGINDKGWVVGYGTTSDNLTAGFVAVPVERGNQEQAVILPQPQARRPASLPEAQLQDGGQEQTISQSDQDDYDVFYTGLSPDEGDWVDVGDYGYCFRPRVSGDWRPYRDGHWVWTDHGWYWDSNERFGWATYHYGRWANIGGTGWCWVPGNQWAPAWVSWRESNEHVGWAPLPPEADISVNRSISSWSDSHYGIGPAAYAFISYSHWREPNYTQYIERPERNVQIIRETTNVTNIITNNNVINSFGPPVRNVERRTNQNIQQVKLELNRATDPKAKYGQIRQGNQLNVTAPPATLNSQGVHAPSVQKRIENPQVDKGWQGVRPQDAEKLKKTIAVQNPPPKDLRRPTLPVNARIGNKAQVPASSRAPGSAVATPVAGQKTPPNLLKPGTRLPKANVPPSASSNLPVPGKKPVPPNLIGPKPAGAPGRSPIGPGEKPTPPGSPAPQGAPPNLNTPSPTPVQPRPERNQPAGNPTPKPTGNLPPTPDVGSANLITPKPTSTPYQPSNQDAQRSVPSLPPATANVPTPTPEGKAAPQETKAPPPRVQPTTPLQPPVRPTAPIQSPVQKSPAPKQETKTSPPEIQHTRVPQPPVVHTPTPQPAAQKAQPPKQEIKLPPPHVHRSPAPQPRVIHTPPTQPPARKTSPQVQHAPAPSAQVAHPAPPQPPAHKAPPPIQPQGGQKHEPAKGKPTPVQ
jgi:probable HAF family extracellular repeat protein